MVIPIAATRWGKGQASSANHAAQVGEKTAVCLLSDRLLAHPFTAPPQDIEMIQINHPVRLRGAKAARHAAFAPLNVLDD